MEKQMLKAADVAAIVGCSTSFAYRLMANGIVPSVKLNGRAVRVPRQALETWLQQQSKAALEHCGTEPDSAA